MTKYFNRLYNKDSSAFYSELEESLNSTDKKFIITANPEAFMFGETDSEINDMLTDEAVTVVADGIGIVKGASMIGIEIPERIPGVEIAQKLMLLGDKLHKSIFFFGAKPEVIEKLCELTKSKYPNLTIAGAVNGYVEDKDAVFEEIKKLSPDIVLVALGIPAQEKLIYKHYNDFEKGIFVGVGGSFDVISGSKARAPQFFINHNIEWLYRILREPKRIKRFYNNNVKFLLKMRNKT